MAYTVKELAKISGVTVRTLHYYDEVGLLKPAYHGANGYRFYEEPQLLALQQILFYRELGLGVNQVMEIIRRSDFDKIAALESHRVVLRTDLARTRKLIQTIERTIGHLKGARKMKNEQLFEGFNPEEQARHEKYLVDRFGDEMRQGIAESKRRVKHWSKADWQKSGAVFAEICQRLVELKRAGAPADSAEVQRVVRQHYEWLKQFWTPTRESYAGHGQFIVESELRQAYEAYDPELPEFAAAGMKAFAETELSSEACSH